MRIVKNLTMTAALLAMTGLTLPAPAQAQHSGVEIWASVCGRCHTTQPPARYTAKDWRSIMGHMTLTARLTDAQRDAVLDFLLQGAMKVSSAPQPGAPVVAVTLAAANGQPVVLNPRPADFTSSGLGKEHASREDLAKNGMNGVRLMPASGTQLSAAEVEAVVKYIQALGRTGGG